MAMEQITLMVHLLVALALIALILLQRGKGTDIGASFGAGASQTIFGSAGSGNALTRMTAWLSAIFFASSFGLAVIADNRTAGEDDLGFDVPVVEVSETEVIDNDMPELEYEPAGDLPLDDAPVLDGE
jgi:preprotein translocase subunit SecG